MEYGHKFSKVYLNTKIFARLTVISSDTGSSTDWQVPAAPDLPGTPGLCTCQNGLDGAAVHADLHFKALRAGVSLQ